MKYKEGDWLEHKTFFGYVMSGFVVEVDECDQSYQLCFPKHKACRWMKEDNLTPSELSLEEDHLFQLIDEALDKGDEKWFRELTDKLPLSF